MRGSSLTWIQIEKFIETIFPSQTAEQAKLRAQGQRTEAEEKKDQQSKDARGETMFIIFIMLIVIGLLATVMVCAPIVFVIDTNGRSSGLRGSWERDLISRGKSYARAILTLSVRRSPMRSCRTCMESRRVLYSNGLQLAKMCIRAPICSE